MSIFELRDAVIEEYREYTQSFLTIQDERIRDFVHRELVEKGTLWPPALVQLNPSYRKSVRVEQLVAEGKLHPDCADIFRDRNGDSITLFQHQLEAIETALSGKGFVVTSGTGSGKSLTYFVPIIDAVLKGDPQKKKVWAIIVYPMNALVNSQLTALDELARGFQERTGREFPVRYNRYTGQNLEERPSIQREPPHILLTNYVMLELMLVRPEEHIFVDRATAGVSFLVVDELHTYRGRQGADVALLIRRLKERCGNPDLICVGTSATMIAGGDSTPQDRRRVVAEFAERVFGSPFRPEQVIEESLESVTSGPEAPDPRELREAVTSLLPDEPDTFLKNPLVAWVEFNFGLAEEEPGRYRRRPPISLEEGAAMLAEETGLNEEECRRALSEVFLKGASLRNPDGEPLLSFKLHQFVAQGNRVYATLEAPSKRRLDMEGRPFAETDGGVLPLFPLKFCRLCGVEYYEVEHDAGESAFYPMSDDLDPLKEDGELRERGYLLLSPEDREFEWGPENLPQEWLQENGRVKKEYRDYVPRAVWVSRDGKYSSAPVEDGLKAWFQPQPFRLCLNCGVFYTGKGSEFSKLTGLSSEGRSSATTVMALSALEHAPLGDVQERARKILSFTDNRQDASLQAGHFNDFVQVGLLRSAIYRAVKEAGPLRYDQVAHKVVEALNLPFREIAANKELLPETPQGRDVVRVFTELVEYRIYEDLRRGWRFVQPNLEQCGLVRIGYLGLEELCSDDEAWRELPAFADLEPGERKKILTVLLDHLRRKLAIRASCLQEFDQQQLKRRVGEYLDERWGFEDEERLRPATRFVLPGQEESISNSYSLGERSLVRRYLRRVLPAFDLDYAANMNRLMDILCAHGLLRRGSERGVSYVQVESSSLVWELGDGTPAGEPIYQRRSEDPIYRKAEIEANHYFVDFYSRSTEFLHQVEGREHTAQVDYERREEREARFREGELKCLFCSPTMELGIDIADLQLVHMRNVPPTPANYAQRSGRAGRKGDPALILTYCVAGSGHDQYFFHHQREMVSGAVQPPRIDLSSEELVRAHLHSLWMAKTGLSLGRSITEIVDVRLEGYPLVEDVAHKIRLGDREFQELFEEAGRIFSTCYPDLEKAPWYSEEWLEKALRQAPEEFDRAFDRFRELYRAADRQWVEANEVLRYPTGKNEERLKAKSDRDEAERQKQLLENITTSYEESDFYPYRYLASEGFLPGYNFPRLPLTAFLPRRGGGDYISRPRFLALSEFGPENLIYHEGAKYQVRSLRTFLADLEKRLLKAKLCKVCGYLHADESVEICHNCETRLSGDDYVIATLLEATGVYARRRERITSEEEERQRYGYYISTHFEFAPTTGSSEGRIPASVLDAAGNPLLKLVYAPSATLYRINHRWKNSKDDGYLLDMDTGEFLSRSAGDERRAAQARVETVRLFVRDTMNLMLIYPGSEDQKLTKEHLATLEHALRRGLERVFQLEPSELASERIGEGERRGILLYEAAEGGYGVLRTLAEDRDALARVAREALAACHYDPVSLEDLDEECSRACYDCLLSYTNQRDYPLLDRALVRDFLAELSRSQTQPIVRGRDYESHYRWLRALTDTRSELERKFLDHLYRTRRRLPDDAQRALADHPGTVPDFFYEKYTCVFCDGSVHDEPAQREKDERVRGELEELGYRVIVIRYDKDLEEQVSRYPDVFGEAGA
ncbi:DEAD/DEAH box helicase [Candidatus Solincola tengchongensis]|uniref:DEAD/DEAH box helicase n=1 Tax=Candidatus Solincola tengchongensis TaxID=2900693 RepID=UPI00257FEFC9|nr:DEAD/DEAH box helicase [Candidatus Solincola tengchongensis]